MRLFVLLCVGIQEQTEIKQSVSKLTEEVSADDDDDDDTCLHICHKALIITSMQMVCLLVCQQNNS